MKLCLNEDCFQYMRKMADNSVDMILTDIPYGTVSGFTEGGLRKINRGVANDTTNFDTKLFAKECMRICKGTVIIFCSLPQAAAIDTIMRQNKGQLIRLLCWEKTNPSPINGQWFFLNSNEYAIACRKKGAYWDGHCTHATFIHKTMPTKIHETSKPVPLLQQWIELCCPSDGYVFDPCAGSMSTGIAAAKAGRNCICLEKDFDLWSLGYHRFKDEFEDVEN